MKIYSICNVQNLTKAEQYFCYAEAYLNGAENLCNKLCDDNEKINYADGAVIFSLTFHAQELFLKAAISKKHSSFKYGNKGHDLKFLNDKYMQLYPSEEFKFKLIFNRNIPTVEEFSKIYKLDFDKANELTREIHKHNDNHPEDQLHRYPFSKNESKWNVLLGFEPYSFMITIKELKISLNRIQLLILAN